MTYDGVHVCFLVPGVHRYIDEANQTSAGGAERQVYLLASALTDRGHAVSVVVPERANVARKDAEPFRVHEMCYTPAVTAGPVGVVRMARELFGLVDAIDADVYYVRGRPRFYALASLCCRLRGRRLIYCIANDSNVDPVRLREWYSAPFLWFYQSRLRHDVIVAQTDEQQATLSGEYGVSSYQIPNGYPVPPEDAVVDHDDRDYVLWVGRINRDQKHPERFVELARAVPDTDFVMVGGPDRDEAFYDEIRADAATVPNLRFEGFVEPSAIDRYYRDAMLLVNTSDYEGFPNTFLEAWRYETPVVSLYHSLDDVLTDQPVGAFAGSMDRLQELVAALAADTERRTRLGRGGRDYVQAEFSMAEVTTAYETVLRSV